MIIFNENTKELIYPAARENSSYPVTVTNPARVDPAKQSRKRRGVKVKLKIYRMILSGVPSQPTQSEAGAFRTFVILLTND